MKNSRSLGVSLILIVCSMASLAASPYYGEYGQQYYRPYLGVEHGASNVEGFDAPYVGLTLGTNMGSRTEVEAFALFQFLSNFPKTTFDLGITETPSAFALISGVSATVKLFRDASFNPMAQVRVGNIALGNFEESSTKPPKLHNFFYGSAAIGMEVNIFEAVSLTYLHGYRYAPNSEVIGITAGALSGHYNSISLRAILD